MFQATWTRAKVSHPSEEGRGLGPGPSLLWTGLKSGLNGPLAVGPEKSSLLDHTEAYGPGESHSSSMNMWLSTQLPPLHPFPSTQQAMETSWPGSGKHSWPPTSTTSLCQLSTGLALMPARLSVLFVSYTPIFSLHPL